MAEIVVKRLENRVSVLLGENTAIARAAALRAEAVLADPGFILVAADLEGADTIGTVATNIAAVTSVAGNATNINTVAGVSANVTTVAGIAANVTTVAGNTANINTVATDLNLGGSSLIGQGPAVIAAIASALAIVPSYANSGGTGARTSIITVTTSASLIAATFFADRLVNGSTSGNTTAAAIVFQSGAGASAYIRFDMGFGSKKVITEAKWYQTGTNTHGTVQWRGSNDAVSWTNIGSTFTLGGSATQTQTQLSANVIAYRYYELTWVSGTVNASQFVYEIEFKIAGSYTDGLVGIPLPVAPNARIGADSAGNVKWMPALTLTAPAAPASGAAVLLECWFHEGDGTVARDARTGALIFDFGSTHQSAFSTAAPKWTRRGLRFRQTMIRTESLTNIRTIMRLVRKKRNNTTLYDMSVSTAGEPIFSMGATFNGNASVRVVTPEGTIAPHYADVSGAAGSASHRLNRGGWVIEIIQAASAFTGRIGLGGHPTGTNPATRSDDLEIAAIKVWDNVLTDAEVLAEANAMFRPLGASRGIYCVVDDCPIMIKGVLAIGQSMIVGDPLLSDLEAWKKAALAFVEDTWFWAAAKGTAGPPVYNFARSLVAARLRVGGNNWPDDMPHAAEHFGFEVGWTLAKQEAFNTGEEEAIFKGGLNGTFLAGPVEGVGGNSMHPAFPKSNGWFWYLLKEIDAFQQYMMMRGIGIRWKHLAFDQGQQECNSANPAAYSLARQQNMQDFWDTLKLHLGSPPGLTMSVAPVHPNAAPLAYSSTYITNVNNGIAAFDAANSDVTAIVVSDLVLTPASTTLTRTVDGVVYPPITPLEQADTLHYPVIDQQAKDRRHRAAAVAAGY